MNPYEQWWLTMWYSPVSERKDKEMKPVFTKEMIKGAQAALEYIAKGAKLLKRGAVGEWFEIVEPNAKSYDSPEFEKFDRLLDEIPVTSAPYTDKDLKAIQAFAKKNSKFIGACAEGQVYLGAPSITAAGTAIAQTNALLGAAGVANSLIELNDDKLSCPAPWLIRRKIEQALNRAIKYVAGDKTTVTRENNRVYGRSYGV